MPSRNRVLPAASRPYFPIRITLQLIDNEAGFPFYGIMPVDTAMVSVNKIYLRSRHPGRKAERESNCECFDKSLAALLKSGRIEFTNPTYGQPYCYNISGESLERPSVRATASVLTNLLPVFIICITWCVGLGSLACKLKELAIEPMGLME